MKWWIYIFCVLIVLGCENDRQLYEGEKDGVSGLYFQYAGTTSNGVKIWQDSILFSFQNMLPDKKEYTIRIPVKLLGFVASYPRPFKVKITGGTAVEHEDYLPLAAEYIFPADTADAVLPVVLKRTDKLVKKSISIELELVENEHFQLLMPEISSVKDTLNATRFKIVYSDITSKPFYWLSAQRFFGNFSVKKINFLNGIMSWTMQDWKNAGMAGALITSGKFNYAATMMRNQLQTLADNDMPEMDEDGNFMQLGSSYKVDYSRYENN